MRIDADLAARAAVLQGVLILVLALILIVALPGEFFETWGWFTGPVAWLAAAAVVTGRLTLPWFPALMGAAFAGVPMLIALAFGLHWIGVLLGIAVFGAWCGTLEPRRPRYRPPPSRRREREPIE